MNKKWFAIFFFLLVTGAFAQSLDDRMAGLPAYQEPGFDNPDWLINPSSYIATVCRGAGARDLVITNGLVERRFRVTPNLGCYSFRNLITGQEMIRSVKPEALLTIGDRDVSVGGLGGQSEFGYLLYKWLDQLTLDSSSFRLQDFKICEISQPFPWTPRRWIPPANWPPKGKEIQFIFTSSQYEGIRVEVHYEIYDGIPLISKWVSLQNHSGNTLRLSGIISESLAVVEPPAETETLGTWDRANMLVLSDYAFCGMNTKSSNQATHWVRDSVYTSQVDYGINTPCWLQCSPPAGLNQALEPGKDFESIRVYELLFDSDDLERKGLAARKMYRTLAPWSLENPIFLHLTSTDADKIRTAVDQCAATGFEMIILSFGSGLNMESTDPSYIQLMKEMVDYANSKGIELGGYSLLASRRINDREDVIHPITGRTGGAIFGNSPCLGSNWGLDYFENLSDFIDKTGFSLLEHDGSYPGDRCASTIHPGHEGLEDSQWNQWKQITSFYKWCRGRDIYLNVPDWYFLSGSNKIAIGYRETNWSLPRDRQIILGRQNIYDGTWEKTPSMGWTFVPLVEYQGGGAAATLEPLSEHLNEYEAHLVQNFGAGVQACYRGPRIYDTEETRKMVSSWIRWYKKYRLILNSDIIHLRRPDGRDWDGFMHVNPELAERGLLMLFNPLDVAIKRKIKVPVYYTGLGKTIRIREKEGRSRELAIDENNAILLEILLPANGYTWFVIE